jgi:hypothetical protein
MRLNIGGQGHEREETRMAVVGGVNIFYFL